MKLLQGGHLLDPEAGIDGRRDILIDGDVVFQVSGALANGDFAMSVPEPSTALLLGLGLIGLAARRRVV